MKSNTTIQAILQRSSIRGYTDEALTSEELATLKAAALASPTGMDRQAQRFLFITNKQLIADIETTVIEAMKANGNTIMLERMASRDYKVIYDAPLFVVVAADENNDGAGTDAGIACQTLALAAKSIGLDSVILGIPRMAFDFDKTLGARAKMPEGYRYGLGIAIGHRAMDKAPHTPDESHIIEVK